MSYTIEEPQATEEVTGVVPGKFMIEEPPENVPALKVTTDKKPQTVLPTPTGMPLVLGGEQGGTVSDIEGIIQPEPKKLGRSGQAARAGFLNSATGLISSQNPQDFRPENMWERFLYGLGSVSGDAPVYIGGSMLGGSPLSPTGMASGFAAVGAIKKVYEDASKKGNIGTFDEFKTRMADTVKEAAKEYAVGRVTGAVKVPAHLFTYQKLVKAGFPIKYANWMAHSGEFIAEIGTMVGTSTGLNIVDKGVTTGEWEAPDMKQMAQDFTDAAILLGGLKMVPTLKRIYKERGISPGDIVKEYGNMSRAADIDQILKEKYGLKEGSKPQRGKFTIEEPENIPEQGKTSTMWAEAKGRAVGQAETFDYLLKQGYSQERAAEIMREIDPEMYPSKEADITQGNMPTGEIIRPGETNPTNLIIPEKSAGGGPREVLSESELLGIKDPALQEQNARLLHEEITNNLQTGAVKGSGPGIEGIQKGRVEYKGGIEPETEHLQGMEEQVNVQGTVGNYPTKVPDRNTILEGFQKLNKPSNGISLGTLFGALGDRPLEAIQGAFSSLFDRKARFPISTKDNTFLFDAETLKASPGKTYRLEEVYHAPDLFREVPEMRDLSVTFVPGKVSKTGKDGITIGTDGDMNEFIAHELQHKLQDIGDLSPGSSPEQFALDRMIAQKMASSMELINAAMDYKKGGQRALDQMWGGDWKEAREIADTCSLSELEQMWDAAYQFAKEAHKNPYQQYYHTGGEIEARNAADTRLMSNEEWMHQGPYRSEDIPLSKWVEVQRQRGKSTLNDMYSIDKLKWENFQGDDAFGTVNNRLGKELEVFERLFGQSAKAVMIPGKLVGSNRAPARSIKAHDLGAEIMRLKEDGTLSRYLNPKENPIKLAQERGLSGIERQKFIEEIQWLRKSGSILSDNGKAGMSADFLLGTCQPTTQCAECYAAASMIRISNVRKAFRNTLKVLVDPIGWADKVAEEAKQIPKEKLPFIRLLGSGDLTTTEQVEAFNHLAQVADRPIQIFSRHHDNLLKLKGTPKAPFIKMGSVDADLVKRFGVDSFVKDTENGIANAFLFTDESQIGAIQQLYDAKALGLILSADHKLHGKLPSHLRTISCPCDAGERSYIASCRQCAGSTAGCFMSFAAKAIDGTGKVWSMNDPARPASVWPVTQFLKGIIPGTVKTSQGRVFQEAAIDSIKKSKKLIQLYIREFEDSKNQRSSIPIKDLRWSGEGASVKDVASAQAYVDFLDGLLEKAQKEGTFYLPGGEIQGPQAYAKGEKVSPSKISDASARDASFGETLFGDPLSAIWNTIEKHRGKREAYKAEGTLSSIIEFFNPGHTIPRSKEWFYERQKAQGMIAKGDFKAEEIVERYKHLTSDERIVLWRYLNGDIKIEQLSEKLRGPAQEMRKIDNDLGKMLVDSGFMSQETYNANQGRHIKYIYNTILQKEGLTGISGSKVNPNIVKSRVDVDETVREKWGLIQDPVQALAVSTMETYKNVGMKEYFRTIGAQPFIRKVGDTRWEVVAPDGKSLGVFSKYADAQDAKKNGRFENPWIWAPSVLEVDGKNMGINKIKRDMDRLRLVPEENRNATQKKYLAELEAAYIKGQDMMGKSIDNYKQLNGIGYGDLDGAYVHETIWNDLQPVYGAMSDPGNLKKVIYGLNALWKTKTVALNVPTATRNVISNMLQLNISGVPLYNIPLRLADAIKSMKAKDHNWHDAMGQGVFKGNFSSAELAEILDITRNATGLDGILDMTKKLGKYYGKIDDVTKMVKFLEERQKGTSVQEAARLANKWGMDYSLVHPLIKTTRSSLIGAPFITYTYKALPLIVEAAKSRPLTLLKWMALPAIIEAITMDDMDEETAKEFKRNLPDYVKNGQTIMFPGKDGTMQALDMSYMVPWGNLYQLGNNLMKGEIKQAFNDLGLGQGLIPSALYALRTGKDLFTGKEIISPLHKGDDVAEAWDIAKYVYDMAMPPMLSMGVRDGALAKIKEHYQHGQTNKGLMTEWYNAIPRIAGVNIYPVDPNAARRSRYFDVNQAKKALMSILRDQNSTDSDKEAAREAFQELLKRTQEEEE